MPKIAKELKSLGSYTCLCLVPQVSLGLWGGYSHEPELTHKSWLCARIYILVLHAVAPHRTWAGSGSGQGQLAVAWSQGALWMIRCFLKAFWGENSLGKVDALWAGGPDSIPRAHIVVREWWHTTRQVIPRAFCPASLCSLVSSRPMRDCISKDKVGSAWGRIVEVDLSPLRLNTYNCTAQTYKIEIYFVIFFFYLSLNGMVLQLELCRWQCWVAVLSCLYRMGD